jgi:hypothetical protein
MIEDRIYPTEDSSAFGDTPEELARKDKILEVFGPEAALAEADVVPVEEPETEKS